MAKGIIFDTDFKIHYTLINGKRKTNEVTQVFQLPIVFYNSTDLTIHDSNEVINRVLVKNNYVKYKQIIEGKVINKRIEVINKLVNLGYTNYEI